MTVSSWIAFALVIVATLAFLWQRRTQRLVQGLARVEAAWKELERSLAERVEALDEMHAALERAGYVPEGRPHLRQAVDAMRAATGPRAGAVADHDVEAVLISIYRGLPRERIEALRAAQNRLAQADEERDIARSRYNDLSLSLALLVRRFVYRSIARRRGIAPPEPFLIPGEEADYVRRHLGHP